MRGPCCSWERGRAASPRAPDYTPPPPIPRWRWRSEGRTARWWERSGSVLSPPRKEGTSPTRSASYIFRCCNPLSRAAFIWGPGARIRVCASALGSVCSSAWRKRTLQCVGRGAKLAKVTGVGARLDGEVGG